MTDHNQIHDLFGSFRAEWLRKDDIYRLFSEPAYFAHLLGNKSCVLMGGRGSGKTTVLRCLSYEGQYELGKQEWATPTHVGVYYRVNTNIVTAFDGPEVEPQEWRRIFGHFLNLTICGELAKYLAWYQEKIECCDLSNLSFESIGLALGVEKVADLSQLMDKIAGALILLQVYINNLGGERPKISQLQFPITQFVDELKKVPGHENTAFHIIFDEYENLLDDQQRIVNTLIKHSGDNCYFKIGVRELGWRVHTTLNDFESLISPADYELIHIEDRLIDDFAGFAHKVCESRLHSNEVVRGNCLPLNRMLPALSTLEEADKLGVERRVAQVQKDLSEWYPENISSNSLPDFPLYVFYQLNREDLEKTLSDIKDYSNHKQRALNKYQNHAHAFLFTLADKGSEISKYYCGHVTFARIANRNIRFYMQLVHESIVQQISVDKDLSEQIDCKNQTIAAQRVGLRYLRELEGATARGSHLSKLILGFGRYFQILAANPIGAAPECNQFYLKEIEDTLSNDVCLEAEQLLTEAVMHLALIRAPGTKLAAEADTRSWDYSLHPIFSPYFTYSSRRKRKTAIMDSDLISMTKSPQTTIKKLLGETRQYLADAELPKQMSMFDEFF